MRAIDFITEEAKAVTQKINPAAKGLQDRHANFMDYKNIL